MAIKNSALNDDTRDKLIPKNTIFPRIYGAPKIHKENVPLKPIVNTIGSPLRRRNFHTKKLKCLIGHILSFIKDSTKMFEEIRDMKIEEDLLVSFDGVSFLTKRKSW